MIPKNGRVSVFVRECQLEAVYHHTRIPMDTALAQSWGFHPEILGIYHQQWGEEDFWWLKNTLNVLDNVPARD